MEAWSFVHGIGLCHSYRTVCIRSLYPEALDVTHGVAIDVEIGRHVSVFLLHWSNR